jgi:adenylate cyclase
MGVLSEYYDRMTELVFASRGMIATYVGDELMAIFGAPVAQRDHAKLACAAALAMRDARHVLALEWAKLGRPPLSARTGINSGPMLVGNYGSKYRFNYSVLGDSVNLASRLEQLNKVYRTDIMIGEQTADLVGSAFRLRELDKVQVMGRTQALQIYELLGVANAVLPPVREADARALCRALTAIEASAGTRLRTLRQCLTYAQTMARRPSWESGADDAR